MLFSYAVGKEPNYEPIEESQGYLYGRSAAQIHAASDDFESHHQRFALDLDHLLAKPLQSIQPLLHHRPEDWAYLQALAARLQQDVLKLPPEQLERGFCHGDFHGGNVHIAPDGTHTFFDFDCCGVGWRAYDLAIYRWGTNWDGKTKEPWEHFLRGYQEVRQLPANPAWIGEPVMQGAPPLGIPHFTKILTEFGLPVEPDLLTELQGMYERVEQPGAFSALLHHDLCPDNMFFIGDDVRLFDFEGARFGHALIDATYARILFPTCWCCNRIPQPVVVKMEAAYRAELIRGCPTAADDRLFTQALGDVCGFSMLEWLRHWSSPTTSLEDRQWGLASIRTRVLARLEAFINTATEFDLLPHLRHVAGQLLAMLQARWSEVEPMPLYPAFR